MRIGLDIHGVLDHHPERFIKLAYTNMAARFHVDRDDENFKVFILTGPTKEKAEAELEQLAAIHNGGYKFWDEVHSIVDYIKDNDIPHHYTDDGYLWSNVEEDWDRVKGELAKELKLDLHFDDSENYRKYFPPGVFCHVERKR